MRRSVPEPEAEYRRPPRQPRTPRSRQLIGRRELIGGGLVLAATFAGWIERRPTLSSNSSDPTAATLGVVSLGIPDRSSPSPASQQTTGFRSALAPGPVIFLDPGHGGVDTGALGTTTGGRPVEEKTVALALARQAAAKLRAAGYTPILSRTGDELPGLEEHDLTSDGRALTPQGVLNDLQRRIDHANAAGASLFLSIHLDANVEPAVRGASTYYDSAREFAADNLRFAQAVQRALIAALRRQGYGTPDLGTLDDRQLQGNDFGVLPGDYDHLVVLGPGVPGRLRPSEMPGALNEALYLSNPVEAVAALDPALQDLIASAYAGAISQFLPLQG